VSWQQIFAIKLFRHLQYVPYGIAINANSYNSPVIYKFIDDRVGVLELLPAGKELGVLVQLHPGRLFVRLDRPLVSREFVLISFSDLKTKLF
jgi:hypothetical protein